MGKRACLLSVLCVTVGGVDALILFSSDGVRQHGLREVAQESAEGALPPGRVRNCDDGSGAAAPDNCLPWIDQPEYSQQWDAGRSVPHAIGAGGLVRNE